MISGYITTNGLMVYCEKVELSHTGGVEPKFSSLLLVPLWSLALHRFVTETAFNHLPTRYVVLTPGQPRTSPAHPSSESLTSAQVMIHGVINIPTPQRGGGPRWCKGTD